MKIIIQAPLQIQINTFTEFLAVRAIISALRASLVALFAWVSINSTMLGIIEYPVSWIAQLLILPAYYLGKAIPPLRLDYDVLRQCYHFEFSEVISYRPPFYDVSDVVFGTIHYQTFNINGIPFTFNKFFHFFSSMLVLYLIIFLVPSILKILLHLLSLKRNSESAPA